MDPNLQNIVAAVIVLAACGYLFFSAWQAAFARKRPGCGSGCSACPSSQGKGSADSRPKVQLITIEPKKH